VKTKRVRLGAGLPQLLGKFEHGQPLDPQAPQYAKVMLEQLAWWAAALRKARSESAYPG
jgi:hypothetical protein